MAEEVKDLLIPHLTFSKDWRNRDHFPTYEPSEDQVRADMQFLHDEIKAYLNEHIAGTLCKTLQKHMNEAVVTKVEFTETAIDGDDITLKLEATTSDGKTAVTECLLKDLAEALREELGSGIKSVEYASEDRSWVFTYTDGRVDRVAIPTDETGIALVSLDTPGEAHTPSTGFVVGQQWLRPAFTVDNHALKDWEMTRGTVTKGEHIWTFTADGGTGTLEAAQELKGLGGAGQKIQLRLLAENIADHQSALTLSLNGVSHDLKDGGGAFETELDSEGNLMITVNGAWTYSASAATVTLKHLVVVNSDAIEAAAVGSLPLSDWPGFLETYAPFEQVLMPRTMFIQEAPGRWVPTDYEVLPASRGGLGQGKFTKGQMFYADSESTLSALEPPAEKDRVLMYGGDKPKWYSTEQAVGALGILRMKTGSYTGNAEDRTLELGITPIMIQVFPVNGPGKSLGGVAVNGDNLCDLTATLCNGATAGENWPFLSSDGGYVPAWSTIKLDGDKLIMTGYSSKYQAQFCNRNGEPYNWVAIY